MADMGAASPSLGLGSEWVHFPRPEAWAKVVLVGLVAALTLAAVALVRVIARFLHTQRVLAPIPDAPGANWLLGQAIALMMAPKQHGIGAWDLMGQWLQQKGPIVRFRILGTQGVIVGDPLALKRIFQQRFKIYAKDLVMSYQPFLPILGSGLVTSDGDLWQKQRLLIGPALRVDILDDIIGIAKRATDRLTEKLEQFRGSGKALSIEEEFRLLTLQVIGEAILSLPPEECDRVFPQLYLPVMEESNQRVLRPWRKYLPTPAWFAYRRRMAQLNSYLLDVIRSRWRVRQLAGKGADSKHMDILDRILAAIESAGTKWTAALETQLCYEIKTFLLAGHETSAAMLTWSLYELTQNTDAMAKVHAEAEAAFGASEAEPSRKVADEMVYTLSVLKESLRRYSVVPVVTRTLLEEDELLGHRVPANTMIVASLQAVHNLWSEPSVFRPDRFMPGGEYDSFEESVRPYMFVPFIQGPRNCLGQHLALLEARIVLALLVKRFRFTLASKAKPQCHPEVIPVASVCGMDMLIN